MVSSKTTQRFEDCQGPRAIFQAVAHALEAHPTTHVNVLPLAGDHRGRNRDRNRYRLLLANKTDCDCDCDPDSDPDVVGFLLLFSEQLNAEKNRRCVAYICGSSLNCGEDDLDGNPHLLHCGTHDVESRGLESLAHENGAAVEKVREVPVRPLVSLE